MMKNDNRCPYCGGLFDISPKHDGIEKWKCRSCGYVVYIDSEDDKRQMYEMGGCVDSIIGHVNGRRSRKMSDKKQEWQEWASKDKIDDYISKYARKLGEDPLFAMVQVANLTYGFQTYESEGAESTKDTAEGLYEIASAYLKQHPEASNLKELAYLYKKKLRNKSSKRATKFWLSFVSVIAVCAAVFVAGMWIYAPSVNDANSGVNISIPNDAISIFQKLNVNADVEKQPQNSVSYIDAKNALRNETEKFDLYDISLKSGSSTLNFDGSVTVSMPIPKGYDTSAIKVFYVSSDETYEEIPSTVSVANNTVTFTTTHFSLYAIAERHPIVIFDTAGGDEVDRQIVKRDDLATAPADPKRNGYTFAGWTLDGQKWDFARDTVKKDITLVALWIPNKYTVTFDTNGGIGTANERDIAYMTTYGSLPTLIKPGYTFVGWYTAAEYGTQVTAETVMDKLSAHTLYARFTINTNKIIFNANGGSGVMNDFSLKSGETARLPQCTYKRTGFKFIGWSTTMTGDVVYTDKAQYTMGTAESYVLYAQWESTSCGEGKHVWGEWLTTTPATCSAPGTKQRECSECEEIQTDSIPNSVTSIGRFAFKGCRALNSVTFGTGLSTIDYATFYECVSLKELVIPANIKTIADTYDGKGVFEGCTSLTKVTIGHNDPNALAETYIGKEAFRDCIALKEVYIGSNVVSIGEQAFYGCKRITTVTFGSGLESIGKSAFANCISLKEVVIPANVITIGANAFENCTALTKAVIGADTDDLAETTVSKNAFNGCTNLANVFIGNSIQEIKFGAFSGCNKLKEITLPFVGSDENATETRWAVFGYIFGDDSPDNDTMASSKTQYLTSGTSGFTSQSYYNNSTTEMFYFVIPKSIRKVTITKQTFVPAYAFQNCDLIEEIIFVSDITSIGEEAFQNCKSTTNIVIE